MSLDSDFNDYYDRIFQKYMLKTYVRKLSNSMPRGAALNYIRALGIKTIKVAQVSSFGRAYKNLVVYTNPKLHEGKGKHVYDVSEAISTYSNCLASEFIEGTNGVSLKFLQVGSRRFRLMMQSPNEFDLSPGKVTEITELPPELTGMIKLPIFSIDYIAVGNEMVAVDFNEVQKLEPLGMASILSDVDVITEIGKAMTEYNIGGTVY